MSEKYMGLWPTPKASRDGISPKTLQMVKDGKAEASLDRVVLMNQENPAPPASHQLTLFAEDSHASLLVQPGSEKARQMTATSGRSLGALLQRSDPVGLWLKMCLDSDRYISTRCYLTWKGWATPQRRPLYRLVPSTPRTDETGFGLWRTPNAWNSKQGPKSKENYEKAQRVGHTLITLTDQVRHDFWPTPKSEPSGPDYARANRKGSGGDDLATRIAKMEQGQKMWTTPGVSDSFGTGRKMETKRKDGKPKDSLKDMAAPGGQLNPQWVEWLMGYPSGWTDLEHSATP